MSASASNKALLNAFENAIQTKDLASLAVLLSDQGEFEIQDEELETITVNKSTFLNWFRQKLESRNIQKVEFDQCTHCSIGATVMLINDGTFPRTIKDRSERSKTGLMIQVQDGKITELKFCYSFLHSENDYLVDCIIKKAKEYQKSGLSFQEAIDLADKEIHAAKK